MKNLILKEIERELNFREKIIVIIFKKTFKKVYDLSRIKIITRFIN